MISQKRYVDITSGVGAGAGVKTRQLTMRVITDDARMAPSEIKKFTTPDDVMKFFGANSQEYARAQRYFGFISKSINAPKEISFVRWINRPIAPSIKGSENPAPVNTIKLISSGTITFDIDGSAQLVGGLDMTTASTETAIASAVTAKLASNTNVNLKGSTVSWDANAGQYAWTGAQSANVTVKVIDSSVGANDVGIALGFLSADAIVTPGQTEESLAECAARTTEEDNNFGSLVVKYGAGAGHADAIALAQWNKAQNNMYMISLAMSKEDVRTTTSGQTIEDFKGLTGCAITLTGPNVADYTDQIPCEILAATDYSAPNATQNYMYYQFADRAVAVNSDTEATEFDKLRVNYIGQTQTGGQKLAFYQRGTLQGGSQDAVDMNTYANEMWLKDYITSQYLSAFLSLPDIQANQDGKATMITILQGAVEQAKYNGVISEGKELNNVQKLYIAQVTGDKMAWHQVATVGFWFDVSLRSKVTDDGRTEWLAKYILVYGKGDSIRAVEGQDILI